MMKFTSLVTLFLLVICCDGFFFSNCRIKKYKSSKYITGEPLLVNKDFFPRVEALEKVAKNCQVHVYVRGSYYQLKDPSDYVPTSDADLVIGHGFQFELRDESNAVLCNKHCLSQSSSLFKQVKCFLDGVIDSNLIWSRYNPTLISDGTYSKNYNEYKKLKEKIQVDCQKQSFKRTMMMALRQMYDDENADGGFDDDFDDK